MFRACLAAIASVAVFVPANSAPATPHISDLQPIPLHSGVNQVPSLAPDGRDGLIVLGWRGNGNAHGYDLALVLVRAKRGATFDVVMVDSPDAGAWTDGITDDPHMGEDMVRAFRFARGRIEGRPATLLLVATRDPAESIPSPSRVTFEVYDLEKAPDIGVTPDHFALLSKDRSAMAYCNADLALSRRFDLPLRPASVGITTDSGCRS